MWAHRPSLEVMGNLFSSRISMVEFGRKPGGVGSLITYMVNGSSPVFFNVNSRFAGISTAMFRYRSAVCPAAVAEPWPEATK
jgi:hypothetical protein